MPEFSPASGGPDPRPLPHTLSSRVQDRVREAGLALDRQARAKRPRIRRRRRVSDPVAERDARTPEQVREARSLRQVFLDLGDSYRLYRHRTGEPVSPGVRSAADRFRRERTLDSLVLVAASLDELDILTW